MINEAGKKLSFCISTNTHTFYQLEQNTVFLKKRLPDDEHAPNVSNYQAV